MTDAGPKPASPLPWKQNEYSGATDSWIDDATGADICRASGTNVAIRDSDAAAIVYRVNAWDALCAEAERMRGTLRLVRDWNDGPVPSSAMEPGMCDPTELLEEREPWLFSNEDQ